MTLTKYTLDTFGDCFKPLASKLLQPIIGEYCVSDRRIAFHVSGSQGTDPCLWFYRLMAECEDVAFRVLSTHPTADILARWKRF